MKRCTRCATAHGEIAWSVAAQADLCERCYCALPEAQYRPPATPPAKLLLPKRLKPTSRMELIERWWVFLAERTGMPVFNVHPGTGCTLAAWCPVCERGTLTADFPKTDPPVVRLGGCSAGCSPRQLVEAM